MSQSPTVRKRLPNIKLASGSQQFQSYTLSAPAIVTHVPVVTWYFVFSLQTDSLDASFFGDRPLFELGLVLDQAVHWLLGSWSSASSGKVDFPFFLGCFSSSLVFHR